uniref:Uncharacterized protein n=1 Tax=Anguilla anguilla TaxID=7936 RepID=A0A0E9Y1A5_ANGAN
MFSFIHSVLGIFLLILLS